MPLTFGWDPGKARANLAKHRVSFKEAATVFGDPLSLTIADPVHSMNEERQIILGHSHRRRLLVVIFIERGDSIRIISTRPATKREARDYEENT
jgi:uncharacterized DUF497 family protein